MQAWRSPVEPTQAPIGERCWNRKALAQILRKLRVIGGREPQPMARHSSCAPRSPGSFGGDMQRLRLKRLDELRHFAR